MYTLFVVDEMCYKKVDECNQTWFHCTACDRKYKYSRSVRRHLRYECGKTPQFQCHLCGKKMKHKSNFKTHLATVHSFSFEVIKEQKYRLVFFIDTVNMFSETMIKTINF